MYEEKYRKYLVLALAVLAGAFACGYFLGLRNAGVPSDGGGTAAVGRQLDAAATNQRQLDASIGRAAEQSRGLADSLDAGTAAVDRGKAAADGIAVANSDIDSKIGEAGNLIASSQRILQEIRRRGESKTGTH